MSSNEFNLDEFLSSSGIHTQPENSSLDRRADGTIEPFKEPGYEGKIDYRIRQLSYSSLLLLHKCPRKFELYKKRTTHRSDELEESTITFAFGHVVGLGIQKVLEGLPLWDIIFQMFLEWDTTDLLASDDKSEKSIFYAIFAVKRFIALRASGLLKDYKLVYYNDKPATELSFCISFPDGFRLRGYVDAVLQNTETGKVLVLEVKTTGSNTLNPATFKNSAQAIGYSIVLDSIFPELSSYEVLYFVYQTKSKEYTPIPFHKTYLQRAQWIRELLLDIDTIKMYEEAEVYPMRGESCYSFYRECEYLNTCTLNTEYLTKPCTPQEEDKEEYSINLTLMDLLNTQLEKVSQSQEI